MQVCRIRGCVTRGAAHQFCYRDAANCHASPSAPAMSSLLTKARNAHYGSRRSRSDSARQCRLLMSTATASPSPSPATPIESSSVRPKRDATSSPLPEDLRQLFRHLASSVVVCTALADIDNAEGSKPATFFPVGLTMSSFTSLSLYPNPVVSFNIAMPSRTEAAIARARHFMVHVLSGDARGAQVADIFRSGNAHPDTTSHKLRRSGSSVVWSGNPPGSPPERPRGEEQPFLSGPGILSVLRCRLLEKPMHGLVPVHDHVIVLGEVLEIIKGDARAMDGSGMPRLGLAYANRQYCQLEGATFQPEPEQNRRSDARTSDQLLCNQNS